MTPETTTKTRSSHLVPTSSRIPGRPQKSTSSQVVPPYGDEVELASTKDNHKNTHIVPNHGTTSNNTHTTLPTTSMEDHQ